MPVQSGIGIEVTSLFSKHIHELMGGLMDISTLSTPTQVILALLLFGLLLTWLIVFATKAFRPDREQQEHFDDLPTPAHSFPAVNVQVAQSAHSPHPVTPLSSLHVASAPRLKDGAGYEVVKDNSPASTMRPHGRD